MREPAISQAELSAAYQRLLMAYPRAYRDERGLEMLTTLLDAAQPGQRRPHWRDALNLVAGGVRARLIGPRRLPYRVITVVVSVLIGLTVSAFAARAAFFAARNAPVQSTALAIADQATGLTHVDEGTITPEVDLTHVDWMGKGQLAAPRHEGWSGHTPSPGATLAFYTPAGSPADLLASTRNRLSAQGWEVGPLRTTERGEAFWAGKDDLIMRVSHGQLERDGVTVRVHTHEPGIVSFAAIGGLMVGTLLGWLAVAWILRRLDKQGPAAHAGVLFMGVPATICAGYLVAWSLLGSVTTLWHWGWSQRAWLMPATALDEMVAFTIIIYTALGLSMLLSLWPNRSRRLGISVATGIVFTIVGGYALMTYSHPLVGFLL